MTRLLIPALAIPISMLLHSCANIASPTGGPKDDKKPKLTKTFPKNGSTNFKGKEVKFVFSEWIAENKLKEQTIITPEIKEYETFISKNALTFKFDTSALKKNTTYYINLRNGIKDLTEGNSSDSNTVIFSTGAYIDSLFISGSVKTALENEAIKNISVNLYLDSDTFDVTKETPLYQTKTEANGNFTITNIKPGQYLLFAINDENKNSKYEADKEYIGYLNSKIDLTNSISDLYIKTVKEDHAKTKVKYIEKKKKALSTLEFNKELKNLEISTLKGNGIKVYPKINDNKVILYPDKVSNDSTTLLLISEDKIGNNGRDTVQLVFSYSDTSKCSIEIVSGSKTELEPTQPIEIELSKAYSEFKPELTIKTKGKVYKNNEFTEIATITENKAKGSITIKPIDSWKDTVQITVFPASFKPVNGYLKDTLKLKYSLKNFENFGSIGGKVECNTEKIIVQLLSKDGKLIKEVFGKKDYLFEYLTDGEYKVRVIEDKNDNKMWDQGDYRTKTLLEPVFHYADVIKLKSNWEILDVKISF